MKRAFCLSVVILCITALGSAQSVATSEFYGSALDGSGASVPDAKVTVTSVERGITFSTVTNGEGYYSISNLLAGTYQLEIQKTGFELQQRKGITAIAGQRIKIDLRLATATVQQSTEISR